jgi:hypothetical protein
MRSLSLIFRNGGLRVRVMHCDFIKFGDGEFDSAHQFSPGNRFAEDFTDRNAFSGR